MPPDYMVSQVKGPLVCYIIASFSFHLKCRIDMSYCLNTSKALHSQPLSLALVAGIAETALVTSRGIIASRQNKKK